ncbi:protein ANTAGONIST OF LIKE HETEROCHROMATIN PROTEIN 1-like [Solenopsis invicta]|uniref:protein ANTAGONIST OF LIKE HETEROCHROMATIN PROTEIN 1-like n=1 Tax=Solenopsis invicta TaxID=13686 RepID=UPI000595EF5C|nr:protein ANTAGONIST OF LIKE HETEROCHROMATIN PROTEIN 1-like [Solenopsis invicta]XP_039307027.1 protein ANTAGONIST OF LIKE HETEROCHROMATIN PROTEIN 1-like [Solenopsis invicta]
MDAAVVINMFHQRNNYSSESSSSSDEDWDMLREKRKRKLRPRIINYIDVVGRYMDYEFKSYFRMSKATFKYLLKVIHEDLIRKVKGCPTIPAHQQLMIALWKMATMDSYRSICDRFNVGRTTALRAVQRVTRAVFRKAARFIQWPSDDRAITVMRGFEEASGFPRVIGAIDGTHICIDVGPKGESCRLY